MSHVRHDAILDLHLLEWVCRAVQPTSTLRLNACIALLYIVLYCNANAIYQWGTLRRALSVGSSLGGGASTMIDDRLCAVRGT